MEPALRRWMNFGGMDIPMTFPISAVSSSMPHFRLPLHYACMADSADHVECLLKAGSDVNAPDVDGRQPLHYAAAQETDTK